MAVAPTSPNRVGQRRALLVVLVASALFMGAEIAGGIGFGSLALLADGTHMASDVAALGIALIALRLSERPHTARHTYGLQRAEVLGAVLNAVVLLATSAWITYEAFRRLSSPHPVGGRGLLLVATLGLIVNVVSAVVLARAAGRSLNMRGAMIHMSLDAAGSVAAIGAGVAVVVWHALRFDAIASIVICALVVWSAWRLLAEAVQVLLEGVPRGFDVAEAERLLAEDPAVESVHHVHIWSLASDVPALSAHVVLGETISLHDAQVHGDRLKTVLADRMGIRHATLELECHDCEPPIAPNEARSSSPWR
jgi:cobalt-zinc-cadmium efflux system protein